MASQKDINMPGKESSSKRPSDIDVTAKLSCDLQGESAKDLASAVFVPVPLTPLIVTNGHNQPQIPPSVFSPFNVPTTRTSNETSNPLVQQTQDILDNTEQDNVDHCNELDAYKSITVSPNQTLTKSNIALLEHTLKAKQPKSFAQHRRKKQPEVPRDSILKALAARSPNNLMSNTVMPRQSLVTNSADATSPDYNNLSLITASALSTTSHLETPRQNVATLNSPCFYHQRFDQVVDFDKVLDEIAFNETMSHSKLLQTATGVREVGRQLQRRAIKSEVKNVMIVTKARDNSLIPLTRELAEWLMKTPRYGRKHGVNVYVDKKLKNSKRFDAAGLIDDEPELADKLKYWTPDMCWSSPEIFDLVLTLGGDGTVLFTSWLFQRIVPPILSFSLGSLGFLTNFQFDLYKQHLDKILLDGTRVNLRMRFTCTVYRGQSNGEAIEAEKFEVLNELVIDRGPSPYVSSLELYGDDNLITVIQADGCIFSTPTGSTAYSLSAGGSLVHPDIPATLITPICPHTLSFRPMILSDSMLLRVNIPKGSRATAHCAFDGRARLELKQGDYITLAASQYPFPTVLSQPQEWIDSLVRTLRWNTRAATQKAFTKDDEQHDIDNENSGWDIDTTDSGCYDSDDGDDVYTFSPMRRQMSLMMGM